jgi:hypothetical protein
MLDKIYGYVLPILIAFLLAHIANETHKSRLVLEEINRSAVNTMTDVAWMRFHR